jgi:hypothetical protein
MLTSPDGAVNQYFLAFGLARKEISRERVRVALDPGNRGPCSTPPRQRHCTRQRGARRHRSHRLRPSCETVWRR